jgi:hypothetical protein
MLSKLLFLFRPKAKKEYIEPVITHMNYNGNILCEAGLASDAKTTTKYSEMFCQSCKDKFIEHKRKEREERLKLNE